MNDKEARIEKQKKIIFFDGVCSLCNGFVDFLIRHDSHRHFHFASLQGSTAQAFLDPKLQKEMKSVLLLDGSQIFNQSQAVKEIFLLLPAPWKLIGLFLRFIPASLSDLIYVWVAKNRYQFFGKKETCRIPQKHEIDYFLP